MIPITSTLIGNSLAGSSLLLALLGLRYALGNKIPRHYFFIGFVCISIRLLLPIQPPSLFTVPVAIPLENFTGKLIATLDTIPTNQVDVSSVVSAASEPSGVPVPEQKPVSKIDLLLGVWAVGFSVLLVFNTYRMIVFWRLRQIPFNKECRIHRIFKGCVGELGVTRKVVLAQSDQISSPCVSGFVTPYILLPSDYLNDLDEPELRAIFFHELGHIVRGDILSITITRLAVLVHWFNPLCWLMLPAAEADCEYACDSFVLQRLAVNDRDIYGSVLIKLLRLARASSSAKMGPTHFLSPLTITKPQLKERIKLISQYPLSKSQLLITSACIAYGVFACTSINLAQAIDSPADATQKQRAGSEPLGTWDHATATPTPSDPTPEMKTPDSLQKAYLKAWLELREAENAENDGRIDEARTKFQDAKEKIEAIQKQDSTWESAMVTARIRDCNHQIEELSKSTFTPAQSRFSSIDPVKKPTVRLNFTLAEINSADYALNKSAMDLAVNNGDVSYFKNYIKRKFDMVLASAEPGFFSEGEVMSNHFFGLNADVKWSKSNQVVDVTSKLALPTNASDLSKDLYVSDAKSDWDLNASKTHGFWLDDACGWFSNKDKFKHQLFKTGANSRIAILMCHDEGP